MRSRLVASPFQQKILVPGAVAEAVEHAQDAEQARSRGAVLSGEAHPVGVLSDGTAYYAPLGELDYDGEDRVRCHLCGRFLRMVGGTHLRVGSERYRI